MTAISLQHWKAAVVSSKGDTGMELLNLRLRLILDSFAFNSSSRVMGESEVMCLSFICLNCPCSSG